MGDALLRSAYRQTVAFVVVIAILGYLGFRASYWSRWPAFEGTAWQVHFHVVTIALWLAMLAAQGWLARKGKMKAHHRLGWLSYILVPVIVAGFVLVTDYGQRRHKEPGLVGAALFDGGLFLFCYAMAIARRRHPPQHATFMMLTPVAFINPALGRAWMPEGSVPVQAALLIALLVAARLRQRVWQPYAVVLAAWCLLLLTVLLTSVVAPQIMDGLWNTIWA